MKEVIRIEDSLTNKISYYHVIVFMACLPFDRFYSELVLISFLIHELIHLNKEKLTSFRLPVLLPVALYLVTLLSSLYTLDKGQMHKDLEKQLALVLFPLIFSVTSLDVKKYRDHLLKIFAVLMLMIVVYLYFDAFRIIRFNKLSPFALITPAFINHNFSLPLDLHATYLSMYVALAAAVFLKLSIEATTPGKRFLYATGLLILMMGILQLSSKSVFIAILIIINFVIPLFIKTSNNRWKFVMASLLITSVGIFSLTRVEEFKVRYVEGLQQDLKQASYNVNVLEPRIVRWRCALEVIRRSPVIGHGTGSETVLLKESYFKNGLYISYLNYLNAHNQYLSFLIKSGMIGLVVFLFVLFFGLRQAIVSRDFVCCSFLIVLALVAMSENILDVNKGIFFFGFFYPFFLTKGNSRS